MLQFCVSVVPRFSGLDRVLVQRVQQTLPLWPLGLQVIPMLAGLQLVALSSCATSPGLLLCPLVEFPEVFLLSLVNNSKDTGDRLWTARILEHLNAAPCLLGSTLLGQVYFLVVQLLS